MKLRKLSMSNRFPAIFLSLLLYSGCSKESIPGFIGKAYTVTVDLPEDSADMEFVWDVINKPLVSNLTYSGFDFTDNNSHMTFTPDVEGNYSFEVNIYQYNDKIATQAFSFEIIDDGFRPEQDILPITEEMSEPTKPEPISETASSAIKAVESEPAIKHTPKPEPVIQVTPEPEIQIVETSIKPKSKTKKPKKSNPGSSIPYDKGRFTIQIASKKNLEDAKRVASDLIKDGFDAYIQKAYFEETDAVWFRIRVGSYDVRETAKKVAAEVSKIMSEPAWVDFVRYEE